MITTGLLISFEEDDKMLIHDMFAEDINRPINGVIKVDVDAPVNLTECDS